MQRVFIVSAALVIGSILLPACGEPIKCGVFAWDETRMRCVCPEDTVTLDDGSCMLPDGGVIVPPDLDAGPLDDVTTPSAPDGGVDACVETAVYRDQDGDGFGDPASAMTICGTSLDGYVANDDDCNDGCGGCHPGGTETCDELDNDCDDATDEGVTTPFYPDDDMDGYGDPTMPTHACAIPSGFVEDDRDCDDACMTCGPGGTETCDGSLDEDCDGAVDNGCACTSGTMRSCGTNEGECSEGMQTCAAGAWGATCSGGAGPRAELCNGLDDDCDSTIDGPVASAACGSAPRATAVACSAGTCSIPACEAGWGNCDSTFGNGCETDVTRSLAHCGSCGTACGWSCGGTGCDDPVQIATAEYFSCARLQSGRVACWGNGNRGQVGDGTTTNVNDVPSLVLNSSGVGHLVDVIDLDVGGEHACAVTSGGNVYCWGGNSNGELGDGTMTSRTLPVLVRTSVGGPALSSVTQVSAGRLHTCARRNDSRVYCWGAGTSGQLGNGATMTRAYAVQVLGPGTGSQLLAVEVEAGTGAYSCGRQSTGAVFCWGSNAFGQLGNAGGTGSFSRPVQVVGEGGTGTLAGALALSLGTKACARLASRVLCWGGSSVAYRPTAVPGIGGAGTLAASVYASGAEHACAVTSMGLSCSGANGVLQLGDGTRSTRPNHTLVVGIGGTIGTTLGTALDVDVGEDHTCAIDGSRRIVCFGANEYAQIGVLAVGDKHPTLVSAPSR